MNMIIFTVLAAVALVGMIFLAAVVLASLDRPQCPDDTITIHRESTP